jgi:hypothetical protein
VVDANFLNTLFLTRRWRRASLVFREKKIKVCMKLFFQSKSSFTSFLLNYERQIKIWLYLLYRRKLLTFNVDYAVIWSWPLIAVELNQSPLNSECSLSCTRQCESWMNLTAFTSIKTKHVRGAKYVIQILKWTLLQKFKIPTTQYRALWHLGCISKLRSTNFQGHHSAMLLS